MNHAETARRIATELDGFADPQSPQAQQCITNLLEYAYPTSKGSVAEVIGDIERLCRDSSFSSHPHVSGLGRRVLAHAAELRSLTVASVGDEELEKLAEQMITPPPGCKCPNYEDALAILRTLRDRMALTPKES